MDPSPASSAHLNFFFSSTAGRDGNRTFLAKGGLRELPATVEVAAELTRRIEPGLRATGLEVVT